jgi:hypothetical protein
VTDRLGRLDPDRLEGFEEADRPGFEADRSDGGDVERPDLC